MREGHRGNALLLELLLVIFFFMIGSMTLVQLFGNARQKSAYAEATNQAIMHAQNIAEEIYRSENPEAILPDLGFTETDNGWELKTDLYTLRASSRTEKTESGVLRAWDITGVHMEHILFTLPSAKYIPGEVSP